MKHIPKVSVIITVYNAEKYLSECMDSILAQTLTDLEIICVDDGSEDGCRAMLQKYADKDPRVIIISQNNNGAAAARNKGIDVASGKYLSILDADDIFEKDMIEKAYLKCEKDESEVCIFNGDAFFESDGKRETRNWVAKKYIGETGIVVPYENRNLFSCTNPAAWNKLFNRRFVLDRQLRFQNIKWANDLCFTYCALALANKISVVDEVLVHYRIRQYGNLQSMTKEEVGCFGEAFIELKKRLVQEGMYERLAQTFANAFVSNINYHLEKLKDDAMGYNMLIDVLRKKYVYECGLLNYTEKQYNNSKQYMRYVNEVLNVDIEGYKKTQNKISRLRKENRRLKQSTSYKIGRMMTVVPLKVKDLFK